LIIFEKTLAGFLEAFTDQPPRHNRPLCPVAVIPEIRSFKVSNSIITDLRSQDTYINLKALFMARRDPQNLQLKLACILATISLRLAGEPFDQGKGKGVSEARPEKA